MEKVNDNRQLYFYIKYNWKTKETLFCRLDDSIATTMFETASSDETLHRCSVWLSPVPKDTDESGFPITRAKELVNESDKLDWRKITAEDILTRLSITRAFPITPTELTPGRLLSVFFTTETREPKFQSELVHFENRRFRISVQEL